MLQHECAKSAKTRNRKALISLMSYRDYHGTSIQFRETAASKYTHLGSESILEVTLTV